MSQGHICRNSPAGCWPVQPRYKRLFFSCFFWRERSIDFERFQLCQWLYSPGHEIFLTHSFPYIFSCIWRFEHGVNLRDVDTGGRRFFFKKSGVEDFFWNKGAENIVSRKKGEDIHWVLSWKFPKNGSKALNFQITKITFNPEQIFNVSVMVMPQSLLSFKNKFVRVPYSLWAEKYNQNL